MSTKDCVEFINNQKIPGIKENLKWKRLSKKNDSDKNHIREFQSSNGDIVVVKEDKNTGELSIVPVVAVDTATSRDTICEPDLKKMLKTHAAALSVMGDYELSDTSELMKSDNIEKFKEKQTEIKEYIQNNEWGCVINDVAFEVLRRQIGPENVIASKRYKAMVETYGVMFDFENVYLDIESFIHDGKKYEVAIGTIYGDWEHHVYVGMYWDKKKDLPVFYVPLENFNQFNRVTKTAYGSESESDNYNEIDSDKYSVEMINAKKNDDYELGKKKTLESLKNFLFSNGEKDVVKTEHQKEDDVIVIADLLDKLEINQSDSHCEMLIIEAFRLTVEQKLENTACKASKKMKSFTEELHEKYVTAFGIAFASENVNINICDIDDCRVVVGETYGDWEFPVNFAMYWDDKLNKPVVYIPMEDFNLFNREFKTAYGSEVEFFKLSEDKEFELDDLKESLEDSAAKSHYRKGLTFTSLLTFLKK